MTAPARYAPVAGWLYLCCFMVFAMAVIGAVTRLTESGLSITEWRPVTGALPPLSEDEWRRVYGLYRESPEFAHKHSWMTLADFKKIFFWEWLHRLWGRLIGVAFGLPLLWFWVRKEIPRGYGWKFAGLFLLGGAQGALGWYMVKSGLADRPEVSHFRLAAHLALALAIFAALWWTALDLKDAGAEGRRPPLSLALHGAAALLLLSATIVWGAFTAGLDAGLVYNSFPLMNGSLTPPEEFPGPAAFFERQAWVQFAHRWLAISAGLALAAFAVRTRDAALGALVLVQIALGVSTLLSGVYLPLAALHQAGAIILLALALRAVRRAGK